MSAEPRTVLEIAVQPTPATRLRAVPSRVLNFLPQREGAFWVLFALAVPKVFGPVFTVLLARFLGPGAAGLYNLSAVPYKFLDNFRNFGTGPALVYERKVSKAAADTAWVLNMVFAVIITGLLNLAAHWLAYSYFGHPEIEPILRWLSIAYIFASVGAVHYFLLLRDLDFRARSVPPLGQVIVAGDVAVVMAIWGFGVGALVGRELTSVILGAILLWAVYPYRPSLRFVPQLAWRLFRYGVWVGLGLTILYASQNIDVTIGGKVIRSKSDIGFYTTSWKLAFIAAGIFTLVASSMVFPSLSRLQDDLSALRALLLKSFRQVGFIMFPAALLLAALAPVIIVPLLGDKWIHYRDSFIVLSLLSIYAGNRTMLSIFFEGYKSIGKPWIVPIYNGVKLAIMIPSMIYGAQHGIIGLALVYIPVQVIETPIALALADHYLDVSPAEIWRAAWVPITMALLMAGAVIVTEVVFLSVVPIGDTFTLLLSLPVAAVTYLGGTYLIDRQIFSEARRVLLRGL
ncbi:MAG: oligosaccharide flippase family protein [Chloroflexota bacterium]|nr:oligosaccharide flippase family protein [Chloroflexota bacterium]